MSTPEDKQKRIKRRNMMARELHKTIYHEKQHNPKKRYKYVDHGIFIDEDSEWWEYYNDRDEFEIE